MPALRSIGLLSLILVRAVSAEPSQDQKAGDQKDQKKVVQEAKGKKKEKPKPDWNSQFDGKLIAVNEKDEGRFSFTVQVPYQYTELNGAVQDQVQKHQLKLAQLEIQLAQATSAQQRQNVAFNIQTTRLQLEQSMTRLVATKSANLDLFCQAVDNMRVRNFAAVQQFDSDTGELLKMTKDRIEEAKGWEGYPGYKADIKILQKGQMVRVYLSKDGKIPPILLETGKKGQAKVNEIQKQLKSVRYDVIMIYVASDPPKDSQIRQTRRCPIHSHWGIR